MNKQLLIIPFFLLLLVSTSVAIDDFSSNVQVFYPMTSNNLIDVSSNLWDGSNVGATFINSSEGFDFTSNDYMRVNSSNYWSLGSTKTISIWFKPDASPPSSAQDVWGYGLDNHRLVFDYINDGGTSKLTSDVEEPTATVYKIYGNTAPSTSWNHLILVDVGTEFLIYLNGVDITGSHTGTYKSFSDIQSNHYLLLGARFHNDETTPILFFEGRQMGFAVLDIALNSTQVSDLYTEGRTYDIMNSSGDNFSVRVKDVWDDSNVNNISVVVNGTTYTNSTGNSIITNIYKNDSNTYSIEVSANNYFSKNYSSVNVSSNLNAQLSQSEILFSGYEIFTNNLLSPINFSVDGNNTSPWHLKAGTYNVTASKNGYNNKTIEFNVTALDNKTINITNISNSRLNLTAKNIFTNASINNLSGWINNNDLGINISYSTTNNFYIENLLVGNYTIFLQADGYAIGNNNTQNITLTELSTSNITFELYTARSILINIYDGTEENLLLQNTTITAVYGLKSFVNYTVTGNIYLDLLTPANYELRISSEGFSTSTLYVTITNDSTEIINIHLINSTGLELQRFLVLDQISSEVGGAIIRLQQEVPGSDNLWITINEKTTSTDGYSGFYVEKSTSIYYRAIVIYGGSVLLITEKTLFLPGLDEVITLQINTLEGEDINFYDDVVTNIVWSGSSNETITFSWADPDNKISGAKLEIWYEDYNVTGLPAELLYAANSTSNSGELSYTLAVVNNSEFTIKAYILYPARTDLVYMAIKIFGSTMTSNQNLGLLLAIMVFLFVAFITISLKPLFSSVLSFSVLGILTAFKLISLPTTIITSFIAIAVIFFIKLKGGNSP